MKVVGEKEVWARGIEAALDRDDEIRPESGGGRDVERSEATRGGRTGPLDKG
jgi:hypothetical protein